MKSVNSDNAAPAVSVVLSVRNGGRDLPQALDTIFNQSFTDFELIAIDNGSTDGTKDYLDTISDPRVRVYHQEDQGLAAALNRGISLARGRYIARQDHDDFAAPTRISKQVAFLDSHPDYALVGTRAEIWVDDKPSGRFHDHPTDDQILRFDLLFNNPFVHSSVMMRKSALDHVGAYTTDPARQPPEDYELWSRIARQYRVANLPERLTVYREVPGSMSRVEEQPFLRKLVVISAENLALANGAQKPEQIHIEMAALVHGADAFVSPKPDLQAMCAVLLDAAREIGGGQLSAELLGRVARAQAQLRHRLMLRQPGVARMWRAVRTFRGRLRRLMPARR